MKITSLHLKNFKRFTNLSIQAIPEDTKLVLLIGANGSGKSSVFDAFAFITGSLRDKRKDYDYLDSSVQGYFRKNIRQSFSIVADFSNGAYCSLSSNSASIGKLHDEAFYGRTSFRQISRLTRTALGQGGIMEIENDTDRPKYFIDRDSRFENDVEKITEAIVKDIFRLQQSGENIRHKYIVPINIALQNIFGNANGTRLVLKEITPPIEGRVAQIIFEKGLSEIHYDLLSAGEKEIFNILINLLSRSSYYQDTIYFFDEIDLHLNTKLQFSLLKEITENWIPENCQLWTASHSLGFIEYAKQSEQAVIIDFDNYDFDQPRVLVPELKENPEVYEIAVGKEFLPSLFQHFKIVFVENKDKNYYAETGLGNTVFVSDKDRNRVYHKVKATEYNGIVDRDFLSDDDIAQIRVQYPNLYVLLYYSIENYLYHPDNLEEYNRMHNTSFDKAAYIRTLTAAKNEIKSSIIRRLSTTRMSYPYFGEPQFDDKPLQKRFRNKNENFVETEVIESYLNNDELEFFYKSLPMKDYCTQLPERQVPKIELSKTSWFRNQIKLVLES